MWWLLIGYLTGRGLYTPDSVKQERYEHAKARRRIARQRREAMTVTPGQWVVVVLAVLFIIGLIVQGVQALFG